MAGEKSLQKSGRAEFASSGGASAPRFSVASPLRWVPLLVISSVAFAVEIPFFFLGTPSGHDVEFHLYSWLDVLAQWRQGIILPRWAALAQFACGEPRFLFYPPASWTLGSLVSAIFPWTIAGGIYIWIALVTAGISMFVLARRWMSRSDAIFAAALYVANPYNLVIVYWRSAFAELLASCLLPLLLLLVLRAVDDGRRVIVPLGLVLAGAWLTNAPAAVMIHYSLALLILFFAWQQRSPRLLLVGAGAVGLGACLSAFYLLPAIYEQRWVNIAGAIGPGLQPQVGFLFAHTTDADHDNFNWLVSCVAVAEVAMTLIAAGAARLFRRTPRDLWNGLTVWAVACSLIMFSITGPLWRFLPKLQFVQFPWRWLLCLSLCFSVLVVAAAPRWWGRLAVWVAMVLVLLAAGHRFQMPWWDHVDDLREMQDNMADGTGYEGVDEYTPLGTEPATVAPDTRKVRVEGPAHSAIHVFYWHAESKMFTAEMSAPDWLELRLFRYPAWKVEVNGRVAETASRAGVGQMLVPVGANPVPITCTRTWDRTAGGRISFFTALSLLLGTCRAQWGADPAPGVTS